MDIQVKDKSIQIGSYTAPKGLGGYRVLDENTVEVKIPQMWSIKLKWQDTTIGGDAVSSFQALTDFLDANLFKNGGGDGTIGVADITGLESGNLIIGGAEGNEQRKLLPSDLVDGGAEYKVFTGNANNEFGGLGIGQNTPSPGTVVVRTLTGRARVIDAVEENEAVTLGQLNARLTAAQRTAINALVSPDGDYADLTEATAAIKAVIDALKG